MIAPRNIDELHAHVGDEIGASGWQPVTQDDVNRFAEATGDFGFAMNYRLNRVRFTSPLPVGDQVRMRIRLESVEPRTGGTDLTATLTSERAGGDRPVCVAEFLIRLQV